jgi:hypothetical protein
LDGTSGFPGVKGDKGEAGFSPPPGQKGERGPPGGWVQCAKKLMPSVRTV